MTDVRPTAEYYRRRAREISRLAWRSRSADVRLELLELAVQFSRMAAHVEKWATAEGQTDYETD